MKRTWYKAEEKAPSLMGFEKIKESITVDVKFTDGTFGEGKYVDFGTKKIWNTRMRSQSCALGVNPDKVVHLWSFKNKFKQ